MARVCRTVLRTDARTNVNKIAKRAEANTVQKLLTKEEAGKILKVKDRRVLALVTTGELKAVLVRDEKSGQMVKMIDEQSLIRYKLTRDHPREDGDPDAGTLTRQQPLVAAVLAAMGDRQRPPEMPRQWLTLEEAEAYTGLPAAEIMDDYRNGRLKGRGHGRRGGVRFKRSDLDAIEGHLVELGARAATA